MCLKSSLLPSHPKKAMRRNAVERKLTEGKLLTALNLNKEDKVIFPD